MTDAPDARRSAPAAARNRDPLLAVLRRVLPSEGLVLELASGSGEHASWFAPELPGLRWQPTDADPGAVRSVDAWREASPSPNLLPAQLLDARQAEWPVPRADAIVCINMIHASPWESTLGLFAGAERTLTAEGAPLVLYGAYRVGGAHTAPSNESFDAWLKERDPRWGVRDLETVVALAEEHGFRLDETIPMPANNFVLVLRRRA